MGFDGRWINLVMSCVGTISYMISHGGKELGPITTQKSLRQGDPLSPYLFILYAKGFSSLLCSYEQSGLIMSCKIARGASIISHILFADDSYIYCKATEEEAHNVNELLYTYEVASVQKIIYNKLSVFYSNNTSTYQRDTICQMLDIYEADENGTYLGLPYSVGKNKNVILGFLKDKIRKKNPGIGRTNFISNREGSVAEISCTINS
ncbi:uncharacterized protein LOC133035986 [Cannabis sativa]|uniref:uncharacterized protein LOC133035986 n=1 Tax=Cannabis sativa TaxID=3483 RepID=UPI0029CA4529|nr:uncharacterized protein LOC133035986 [Cannabis sativa]